MVGLCPLLDDTLWNSRHIRPSRSIYGGSVIESGTKPEKNEESLNNFINYFMKGSKSQEEPKQETNPCQWILLEIMECMELYKGHQHERFQLSVQKWFHWHLLCTATIDCRYKKLRVIFGLTNQETHRFKRRSSASVLSWLDCSTALAQLCFRRRIHFGRVTINSCC